MMNQAFSLAKQLIKRQMPKDQIGKLLAFIRHYLSFEKPENEGIFGSSLRELTKGDITMGIEDAILEIVKEESEEKGIQKGIKLTHLKNALKMKQKGIDITIIAEITGLSKEEIDNL